MARRTVTNVAPAVPEPETATENIVFRRIVLRIPGPEEPGFMRRQKQINRFYFDLFEIKRRAKEPDYCPPPRMYEDLGNFLLDHVAEPVDRDEARALLDDLSQDEFWEVFGAVAGAGDSKNSSKTATGKS
jgi:hypothetical protein